MTTRRRHSSELRYRDPRSAHLRLRFVVGTRARLEGGDAEEVFAGFEIDVRAGARDAMDHPDGIWRKRHRKEFVAFGFARSAGNVVDHELLDAV